MPLDGAQTQLVERARAANAQHREALTARAVTLKSELIALNELIATVESIGDEDLLEDAADMLVVYVQGAARPIDWIPRTEYVDPASPFFNDARRRQRYLSYATPKPLGDKEKQNLREAVCNANKRVIAARAQAQGLEPWTILQEAVDNDSPFLTENLEDLDWASIAADYSAAVYPLAERTAIECEVFWHDGLRPNIRRGEWSEEEEAKLQELVAASPCDPPVWEDIAEQLGTGRVALDCMKCATFGPPGKPKVASNTGIKVWSEAENERLLAAVKTHGRTSWQLVSMTMGPTYTGAQCEAHYRKLTQIQRRGAWTADEDAALRAAVELYPEGTVVPFKQVAKLIDGRSNVQCRDRWLIISGRKAGQKANPRRRWTEEEDAQLVEAVEQEMERIIEQCRDENVAVGVEDVDWTRLVRELDTDRQVKHCKARYRMIKKQEAKRKGKGKEGDGDTEDENASSDATGEDDDDTPPPPKKPKTKPKAKPKAKPKEKTQAKPQAKRPARKAPARRRKSTVTDPDDEDEEVDEDETSVPKRRASTRRKGTTATAREDDTDGMDIDEPDPAPAAPAPDAGPSTSEATEAARALIEMGARKKKELSKVRPRTATRRSLAEVLGDDDPNSADEESVPPTGTANAKDTWTPEDDAKLLNLAEKHKLPGWAKWRTVAKEMDGHTARECSTRYKELTDGKQANEQTPQETRDDMDVDPAPGVTTPSLAAERNTSTNTKKSTKAAPAARRRSTRSTRFRASLADRGSDDEANRDEHENESAPAPEPEISPNLVAEHAESMPAAPVSTISAASRRWTDEQDERLIGLVGASADPQRPDWKAISADIPGRTAAACSTRYGVLRTKGKVPTNDSSQQ